MPLRNDTPSTANSERVTVLIGGKELAHWSELELHNQIDCISSARFSVPFDPTRKDLRDLFRPFTYKPLDVLVDGSLYFSGRVVGIEPALNASERTVEVTAYAHAGALNDCTYPASADPNDALGYEFKELGLYAIASSLCQPFGLKVDMPDDAGAAFKRVRLEVDRKLLDFLADLARQRNLVLCNTASGDLRIWRSIGAPDDLGAKRVNKPVADLVSGQPPITSIAARFAPQEYYSEVTCFSKTTRTKQGARYTHRNRFLPDVLRPLAFKLEDTDSAGAPSAARAKLGRMFGNMVEYAIERLPTWRTPDGKLWSMNTTVTLTAPEVMVYSKTELLVRGVTLRQRADELTADLDLVLPGSFSGEQPRKLPWTEPSEVRS